ncbi:MAG: hypothetical protein NT069_02230 [Planctomycetota bacterium]|nr:hypothetical protein [Planctomycetota bacterium]
MRTPKLIALAVPTVASLVSLVLFIVQGGFGGGHGRFDYWIFVLNLPSFFLIELVPEVLAEVIPVPVWLLALPYAGNVILAQILAVVAERVFQRLARKQ